MHKSPAPQSPLRQAHRELRLYDMGELACMEYLAESIINLQEALKEEMNCMLESYAENLSPEDLETLIKAFRVTFASTGVNLTFGSVQ